MGGVLHPGEAIRIDLQHHRQDHPQYIRHLHNLATALHEKGDLDSAEPLYRQTVDLLRQVLGAEHSETIEATGNLGRLLEDMRSDGTAEPRPDTDLLRVMQAAASAARQSRRRQIDGAIDVLGPA